VEPIYFGHLTQNHHLNVCKVTMTYRGSIVVQAFRIIVSNLRLKEQLWHS